MKIEENKIPKETMRKFLRLSNLLKEVGDAELILFFHCLPHATLCNVNKMIACALTCQIEDAHNYVNDGVKH